MSVQKIASRYAQSLLELAIDQDKLERVMEDVQTFKELSKNRDFYLFIKSPLLPAGRKIAIVRKILESRYDILTLKFLELLIKKGREKYMPEIATEFVTLYKKVKHISTVYITSAAPLSEAGLNAIRAKLHASNLLEENIEIQTKVDPELIAGFIIEFDDFVYDATVSHKLSDLRKGFAENLYIPKFMAR